MRATSGEAGGDKQILIVDDSKTVRTLLQIYLSGFPVRCEVASSGRDALSQLVDLRPDLVITDLLMPGIDGFELLAAIRASPTHAHVPVVMLTSEKDEASRQRGRAAGASAFLNKPVTVQELRQVLSAILGLGKVSP